MISQRSTKVTARESEQERCVGCWHDLSQVGNICEIARAHLTKVHTFAKYAVDIFETMLEGYSLKGNKPAKFCKHTDSSEQVTEHWTIDNSTFK